jgi:hypothetical protein
MRDIVAVDMFALATAILRATVAFQIEKAVAIRARGSEDRRSQLSTETPTSEDLNTRDWYD